MADLSGDEPILAATGQPMTRVAAEHGVPGEPRIADNKTAESPWNEESLKLELQQLEEQDFRLDLTGFSDEELENLLREPEETPTGNTDEDAVPDTPETAVTVQGDVWLLGSHRLLCGDSMQMESVERVLAGG